MQRRLDKKARKAVKQRRQSQRNRRSLWSLEDV